MMRGARRSGEPVLFDTEITDLRGFILATTRADRAGMGPDDTDPIVFRNYSEPSITIPLSELREAETTLSVYDDAAETLWFDGAPDAAGEVYRIGALGRMLRMYFRGSAQPLFWDVIYTPDWKAKPGYVVIQAQQHPRLKAHFAHYGDQVVGPSSGPAPDNPLDYRTLRALIDAAENLPTQNNYPPLGIDAITGIQTQETTPWVVDADGASGGSFTLTVNGNTTASIAYNASAATVQSALEALTGLTSGNTRVEKPVSGVSIWGIFFTGTPATLDYEVTAASGVTGATLTVSRASKKIDRGANIFDELTGNQETRYGGDFEFEPRDDLGTAGTDDDGGTWPLISRLNTYDKQGTDRSATVTFKYVQGETDNNLDDFGWEPGGPDTRNEVTMVTQGTETEPGRRTFGHDLSAWKDVGIYAEWQNPEGGNQTGVSDRALQDLANDQVAAQGRPPNYLTLPTRVEGADSPDAPVYGTDYFVGDIVAVECAKGGMQFSGNARVTKVILRAADKAGNGRTEITVVPSVASQDSITTGGDS